MSQGRDIKELIQAIAGEGNSVAEGLFFVAEVKSATDEACTINIDGLELSDVRTGAVIDNNTSNLRIKPKAGSKVLVCDMSGNFTQLFVVAFSQVDSITINGGSLGGLVNINTLTSKLNEFVKKFNNHTHVFTGTVEGTACSGTTNPTLPQQASLSSSDYEDTKIKH